MWLIHVVRGLPAGRFQPYGVTASGYGAENAWEVRAVRYSPVGDEVIPLNAKNASLTRHVECLHCSLRESSFKRVQ